MLVLSRKAGEKICIGEGISVVVNRISGGRVTLAIEAPASVRILRGELAAHDLMAGKTESDPAAASGVVANGVGLNAATSNGATLSNSMTLTAPPVTPGPRSTTMSPALTRRAMLPPGPLRQALNSPQALNGQQATNCPPALSNPQAPR